MKPGLESQTAVAVCMARAYAHGTTTATRFSDPVALALLPEEARVKVERARAHTPPDSVKERWARVFLDRRSNMMVPRTIAIDDAIREVPSPQLVILGAGLDGRAWRMPELRDATVFEVDHPDSQARKRERTATLTPTARDVRFVAVDFTRDSLEKMLAKAGHDASRPTTWVWEGVVMYLTREQIEGTLKVIERRSAPQSRLIIAYAHPTFLVSLVGSWLRSLGEPIRSTQSSDEMRALLTQFGFGVVRDEDVPTIARRLPDDVARAAAMMKHLGIVTADRAPSAAEGAMM